MLVFAIPYRLMFSYCGASNRFAGVIRGIVVPDKEEGIRRERKKSFHGLLTKSKRHEWLGGDTADEELTQ